MNSCLVLILIFLLVSEFDLLTWFDEVLVVVPEMSALGVCLKACAFIENAEVSRIVLRAELFGNFAK